VLVFVFVFNELLLTVLVDVDVDVLVLMLFVVTELVLFDVELVSTKLRPPSYVPLLINPMVLVVVPAVVFCVLVLV